MQDRADADDARHALQRALGAIRDLRARLDEAERVGHEPVAIIGAGCRFPGGADSPEQFWTLLHDQRDVVGPIPSERWDHDRYFDPDPDTVGTIYTDQGGFVRWPVDQFDAGFFGISPREAETLDPQQRLLLEVAWETFEHAGIAADQLAGTPTGVFVGIGTFDYANLQVSTGASAMVSTYYGTGVSASVAAGRIAYVLGLRGPVLSLDTACSSSLVATALAVQSLRAGACRTALAGGVNLMLDPQAMVFLSAFRALSPTGRCHAFDESADGYVRGEGCGLVLLKRLSDAEADGDRVLAVIRGAATNHDGRSSGLTVPNGSAQRSVIQAALDDAGLSPVDVQLVEAHGTGTELGDPIEVRALDAVYSPGRAADDPLHLASVKTNIGHLEAAAGAAGLIKVVQALRHEEMPAQLHCDHPSPHIDWASMPIEVLRRPRPWPRGDRARRAAISAFGFSGTNAHVVVEEAPPPLAAAPGIGHPSGAAEVIPISARDDAALHEAARRYGDVLAPPGDALADVAWTAQTGRARFPKRLAVAASSASDAAARLRAWADGETDGPPPTGVTAGDAVAAPPGLAFLFTGQGAQLPAMGRHLFERRPAFRATMETCDELLRPHLDVPLLDVLYGRSAGDLIHDTTYTQPAMFALEYALATLWTSWGIRPAAVAGHSIGEYAAACLAGVIDLPDALRLIATRGRLMGALPAGGRMLAVFASEDDVRPIIARHAACVGLAAINGPTSVVVSGSPDAIAEIATELTNGGVQHRPLEVSHAFHSPLMAPMIDEFAGVASSVALRAPSIPFVSAVTGHLEREAISDAAYWRRHVEATVRFGDAVTTLRDSGITHFVEIGPQATLLGLAERIVPGAVLHPSLRPGTDDDEQMTTTLGALWVAGVEPDWTALHDGPVRRVDAPTYPFQRRRHWLPTTPAGAAHGHERLHPLVHRRVTSPVITGDVYESVLTTTDPGFLDDHRLFGTVVIPATAHLEAVVAALRDAYPNCPVRLDNVALHEVMVVPDGGSRRLQVVLDEATGGRVHFAVHTSSGREWRVHLSGSADLQATPSGVPIDIPTTRAGSTEAVDVEAYYDRITSSGIGYGPAFRVVHELVKGDGWSLGRLAVAGTSRHDLAAMAVHPALLDGALQLLDAALPPDRLEEGDLYVPVSIGSYRVHRPGPAGARAWATVRVPDPSSAMLRCDIDVFDDDGAPIASIEGLELRQVSADLVRRQVERVGGSGVVDVGAWFHEVVWELAPLGDTPAPAPGSWIIVTDDEGRGADVARQLEARGQEVVAASPSALPELLLELVAPADGWAGIVVELSNGSDGPEEHGVRRALGGMLAAVQTVLGAGTALRAGGRLWLVTRNGRSVQEQADGVDIAQATLWGFADSLAVEEPQLHIARVDLAPRQLDDAAVVVGELVADTADERIAYRNGARYVARLARLRRDETLGVPSGPYEVVLSEQGTIDGLDVVTSTARPPGPGEVSIAVRASGLNFRDVLGVMGMYPGALGRVGSECAGVVTAVGDGVESVAVGDDVVALVDGGFVSDATTSAVGVFRVPANVGPVDAATLPIAFLTAHYGLVELAGVGPGDVVLVHAAAGGVGMAAVQIARRHGADVIATAGSAEKRSALRALGIEHVFDSRSLDFAPDVMAATGGRGVDIALNALADDFVGATLDVVADGGTFLEIGKRGIHADADVAVSHPTIRYAAYDLTAVIVERPELLRSMMETILAEIAEGALTPLPRRQFALADVRAAFRFMAMARHVGKVVVTHPGGHRRPGAASTLDADGTYLITGGLGGLGLAAARSLIARGATHLALVGRRPPTPEVATALDALRDAGASIVTYEADVGDRSAVATVLDAVRSTMPPLRGVVHAAGVLDDGVVRNLDWSRLERVLRPKLDGARHLDELTRDDGLDLFVLYSSATSLLPAAGQANYAAANAGLDALAHRRQAQGLPALSIDWGPWSEIGMAAGLDEADQRRMASSGIALIDPEAGDRALGELLSTSSAQVGVLPIDWELADRAGGPTVDRRYLARVLAGSGAASRGGRHGPDLAPQLAALDPDERFAAVRAHVRDAIAAVLGLDGESLESGLGLPDLGMDSLMAVELSNRLQRSTGCLLASTAAFEHPTLEALSRHLAHDLLGLPRPAADADARQRDDLERRHRERLAAIGAISEAEAEASLLEELRRSGY